MFTFFKRLFSSKPVRESTPTRVLTVDELLQSAYDIYGFDFISIPGKEAFEKWRTIKAQGEFYPVIIGPQEELQYLSENFEFQGGTFQDLDGVDDLVFPDLYLEEKRIEAEQYRFEYPDDELEDWQDAFELSKAVAGLLAEWTDEPYADGPPAKEPLVVKNFSDKYHKEVFIALVPTNDWTVIPAILRFGGWNECPSNEWHVAAFRYWQDKFGAELVSMTHDVVELRVKTRPTSPKESLTLAMEQYYYCHDIVSQGVNDPANLAKILMTSDFWYFWWD